MRVKTVASYLPRLGFLLFAISPVTERNDRLFYVCIGLAVLSFFLAFALVLLAWRNKESAYLKGSLSEGLGDVGTAIVGLLVCYSLDCSRLVWFWWIILIFASIEVVHFAKKYS